MHQKFLSTLVNVSLLFLARVEASAATKAYHHRIMLCRPDMCENQFFAMLLETARSLLYVQCEIKNLQNKNFSCEEGHADAF